MKRMQLTGITAFNDRHSSHFNGTKQSRSWYWSWPCKRIHLAWTGFRKCEHPTFCFRILQRLLPFRLGSVGLDKEDTKEFDLTFGYSTGGIQRICHWLLVWWRSWVFFTMVPTTLHMCFEAQVGYDFGPLAVNWYTNFAGADGVKANGDRAYSSYFSIAAPSS